MTSALVNSAGKDAVAKEIEDNVRRRARESGLEIASVGIGDVILPGDMKDLMNKVNEACKAAEANLISRREETAAMQSQANTAKLLADNPILMRLREREVLKKSPQPESSTSSLVRRVWRIRWSTCSDQHRATSKRSWFERSDQECLPTPLDGKTRVVVKIAGGFLRCHFGSGSCLRNQSANPRCNQD